MSASGYHLFLDDVRTVQMVYPDAAPGDYVVVRSYAEFVAYIQGNGLPDFISFDNDLGLDATGKVAPDGYDAAKWLVFQSGIDIRNLRYKVHSANPVAAESIRGLLENYLRFLREEE